MSAETRLEEIALAVADLDEIDWDTLTTDASPAALAELRVVAALAAAHRHPDAGSEADTSGHRRIAFAAPDLAGRSTWGELFLFEQVGRGSFGDVYRAWDPSLQRYVALKLLADTDATAQGTASSLVREGRLLARIRHTDVVTVYGAATINGRDGVWMEFVEGKTLESLVREHGAFGGDEAVVIAGHLARALAAVHGGGLLHRDVKASNVMREAGGRIVLMDFGAGFERHRLSPSGTLSGTPLYLAPELLEGRPATPQTDLYALGVLLFFLVTRSYPVTGTSLDEVRQAHKTGRRAHLADLRPDLPPRFVAIVERLVAADPAHRFESAGALLRELSTSAGETGRSPSFPLLTRKRAIAALAAVAVGIGGAVAYRATRPVVATSPSIAIMPFTSTGPGDLSYFGEGIAQEIGSHLARLDDLRVVPVSSMTDADRSGKPPVELGRTVGAQAVLTGEVTVSGEQLRVAATLTDASSARPMWSETFVRRTTDLFAIQADICQRVALALRNRLTPEEMRRIEWRSMDYDAYSLYLRGRNYLYRRTPNDAQQAMSTLQQALVLEPDSAQIRTALAESLYVSGVYEVMPKRLAFAAAEREALAAVKANDTLPEAHLALGVARHLQLRWEEAEAAYLKALGLSKNLTAAYQWYGLWLAERGRSQEALQTIDRAVAIDPLSVGVATARAVVLGIAGRYDEAIAQTNAILARAPGYERAFPILAELYSYKSEHATALAMLDRADPLGPNRRSLLALRAYILANAGRSAEASGVLEQAIAPGEGSPASPFELACAYSALAQPQQALEQLQRAREELDDLLVYALVEPKLSRLRGMPAFDDFLRTIGFKTVR